MYDNLGHCYDRRWSQFAWRRMIRETGWSARFATLERHWQDMIIQRPQQRLCRRLFTRRLDFAAN